MGTISTGVTQSFQSLRGTRRFPLDQDASIRTQCHRGGISTQQGLPFQEGLLIPTQTGLCPLGTARRNGLPTIPHRNAIDLGLHLWEQHTYNITQHIITTSSITNLQSQFEGAIFHCEKKHASSLRIFCPCLYFSAIEATFTDTSIFLTVAESPSTIVDTLVSNLINTHGHTYPWAVGKGRQMPSG